MQYDKITQTADNVPGWPVGIARYLSYADSVPCYQAKANFLTLTPAEQIAATELAAPVAGAEERWIEQACAGGPSTGSVYVESNPDDFTPTGGTAPVPTDGSAWTAGNPNDTDDQGQAVTHSNPVILTDTQS